MSVKHWGFTAIAVVSTALWLVPSSPVRADEGPELEQGQEVLTHGPVHEAFASPTVANPTPSLIVPKEPPAPIEELPPDVKPDGANVVWVTGYWAWDDARRDFLWVSGIWRDTPPNHVWVTGYWTQVADGYQWTPGFWSPAEQEEVNYLPEPPQTVEQGPSIPQPSANDFWVPGNWQYVQTRYVWRPGYWTVSQPDWIWTPAHYVWTPSGYIFIPGHWDYVLERRGVLFAPVYFSEPIYARRHFVFAPSVVIDSSLLTVNFFVRPHYYHYYFGDCYGESFATLGYSPWFSVGVHFGPDPLFAYYSWHHRDDRRWSEGLHEHYTYLHSHPDARPPQTFVQQTTIINNNNITINNNSINNNSNNKTLAIGAPLNQYVKNTSVAGPNNVKFVNVSNQQRHQIEQENVKSHDFARERARMEGAGGGAMTGIVGGAKGPGPNLVGPKGPGPGGDTPKSLDLHKLAQTSGAPLPGTTVGGSKTGVNGPGPGTLPGGSKTGITGPATLPGGSKTGVTGPEIGPGGSKTGTTGPVTLPGGSKTGVNGPDTGPGGSKTTGPGSGRPTTVGPSGPTGPITGPGAIKGGTGPGIIKGGTDPGKSGPGPAKTGTGPGKNGPGPDAGPGPGSGRPTGPGDNPIRLKPGDSIKSGPSTGPGSSKPLDLPKGPSGKPPDSLKGPSSGRPSGPPPSPVPSDRGKGGGDPRGKKPDDKKDPNDPRGRALITPGNTNRLTAAESRNLLDNPSGARPKDAVGPLNVHPRLASEAADTRAAATEAANRAALATQPPLRVKDPVAPLTVVPRSPPVSVRNTPPATLPANNPALRSNAEQKAKDPIQPLRIAP